MGQSHLNYETTDFGMSLASAVPLRVCCYNLFLVSLCFSADLALVHVGRYPLPLI